MSGYFTGLVARTAPGARIQPSASRYAIAAGQPEVEEIELPARLRSPANGAARGPAPERPEVLPVARPHPDPAPSRAAAPPENSAAARHASPAVVESARRGAVTHRHTTADDGLPPAARSMRPLQRATSARDTAPAIEPRPAAPAPPPRQPHQHATAVSRAAGSTTVAVDQPPDVHIHIGRIELTAAAPPAAPQRPPSPPVKPALPLEEYLQRRNRRSR